MRSCHPDRYIRCVRYWFGRIRQPVCDAVVPRTPRGRVEGKLAPREKVQRSGLGHRRWPLSKQELIRNRHTSSGKTNVRSPTSSYFRHTFVPTSNTTAAGSGGRTGPLPGVCKCRCRNGPSISRRYCSSVRAWNSCTRNGYFESQGLCVVGRCTNSLCGCVRIRCSRVWSVRSRRSTGRAPTARHTPSPTCNEAVMASAHQVPSQKQFG